MIDIKVYVLLDDFSYERRTFKRYLKHAFGKINFAEIYGIDFLFNPLSLEQYVRLGNSLNDCIVSNRLARKLTGWTFLVSNYCMFTLIIQFVCFKQNKIIKTQHYIHAIYTYTFSVIFYILNMHNNFTH